MQKTFVFLAALSLAILAPASAFAGIRSELKITADGKVSASNVKVFMISDPGKSTFFYTRAYWDDVFMRMTVLTDQNTSITKKHGEKMTVFDIKEGDMLSIEGILPSSSDTLNIKASKIVDLSQEKESKEASGKVTSIDSSLNFFNMLTAKGNSVKVNILGGTTIIKGARTISVSELSLGDTILSITGIYDYQASAFDADRIEVYQNKSVFYPRNFQGTLKSLSGTSLPVTAVITVSGKDYTVYLPAKAETLSKNKSRANLTRFVVGDTVRFYGAIRQTDLSSVDADVIRDLNF